MLNCRWVYCTWWSDGLNWLFVWIIAVQPPKCMYWLSMRKVTESEFRLNSVIISCDQAALWMVFLSVCPICPSATPFWLCSIALNLPVRYATSGIYGIEGPSEICTQSADVRLAVSGAQPLFTLGLLMFALSLVDFLFLLLSPSTYFKIFYFFQKYD